MVAFLKRPGLADAVDWLRLYLEEDLGEAGDITSAALFTARQEGSARVVARQACVVAGLGVAAEVFARLGANARPAAGDRRALEANGSEAARARDGPTVVDGQFVPAGTVLLGVTGPVQAILAAERTALNILGRMSGIATATRRMGDVLAEAGSTAQVAGTRKTTPGFREYEKQAIRIGGGDPHRMGLFDAMMVKDNHRAAAGDLGQAIARLRAAHPDKILEVEVESEADARLAAEAGVDWVLIDNQRPDVGARWAQVVRKISPETKVEASGGIGEDDLLAYGWADRISLGALTHHVRSVDVGLDWGADAELG